MNEGENKIVYPKQYGGYILWGSIWMINAVVLLFVIIKSSNIKLELNLDTFAGLSFLLVIFLYPVVVLVTILQFMRKKIYIQYSEKSIIFKGLFIKRSIDIEDIKSITKTDHKNLLGNVYIEGGANFLLSSFNYIRVPMIWFDEMDIYNMFDYLMHYNKKILTQGIYAETYIYDYSKKKIKKK